MYYFMTDSFSNLFVRSIQIMVFLFSILHIFQFYEDTTIYLSILMLVVFSFALLPMVPLGILYYVISWMCLYNFIECITKNRISE